MPRERKSELTHAVLMGRQSWSPLPAVCVLHGNAPFFRREIQERFARELASRGGDEPWIRRYRAADKEAPTLASVLDDLCTPSFLASNRLVVVEAADQFLSDHKKALAPFVEEGFAGGHLILHLDSLDLRTRFARLVSEKGWAVSCQQPFDRPPPWEPHADPWNNDLARWVAGRARGLDMAMSLETAHAFCQRVGTDLATLAEELDKLRTYLGTGKRKVDLAAVDAVAGELREDSIFDLIDAFLSVNRPAALRIARRLFRGGYRPARGNPVMEPVGILILFIGGLVGRLRALRRAHALAGEGKGPEAWISLRLTPKPFLPRFQRDLRATPPERIDRALQTLREIDRAVKTGARAQPLLELFLMTC